MTLREQIVALHLRGLTYGQIKYATGVSRGTIGGHLSRWRKAEGVDPGRINERNWTESEEDELIALYLGGATVEASAKALGRTTRAIQTRISVLRSEERMHPKRNGDHYSPGKAHAARMREDDAAFVRALAEAFQRGDHLPAMGLAA